MGSEMCIRDSPTTGVTYTLEYTRKTVEAMEKNGFVAADVERKPMTLLPALFAGAFLAHHRFVKRDVIDSIYARMNHKDELIAALVEMYNDPLLSLLDEPEQEGNEGNLSWKTGWEATDRPEVRGAAATLAPLPFSLTRQSFMRFSRTIFPLA